MPKELKLDVVCITHGSATVYWNSWDNNWNCNKSKTCVIARGPADALADIIIDAAIRLVNKKEAV